VHLSELPLIRGVNGWGGEPRKDTSIEDNPIRIRGEVFKRGMGVHAVSELVYPLAPQFKRFVAVVGVDDEKDSGSVTFEVQADQKSLFKSEKVTRTSDAACIDVEIPKGSQQLRLLVGDAGDGIGCDHADWANAGFMTGGEKFTLPPPPPPPPPYGAESIFSGKDLAGQGLAAASWEGDAQVWSVKDGVIRGKSKAAKQGTCLLWRGGKLRDFELRLKFRVQDGSAGVLYRAKELGSGRVSGYQAGNAAALAEEGGRGPLANAGDFVLIDDKGVKQSLGKVADKPAPVKAKDWNELTIAARGNHLVHTLNGLQTVELIDDAKEASREGVLALELQAGAPTLVEFKDIFLKRLTGNYGKAIRLFNGKDLTGWTFSSDGQKGTWSAKDGVIVDTGKPAGYLRTIADYTNYTLRLQLRHVTQGNSGVLVRMVGEDKVWPKSIEAQGMFKNMGDIFNIGEFPMKTDPARTKGRHTLKMHPTNEGGVGEWKVYEITLDGGNLEIAVNGLVQNTATECWETPGKICLQSEGAEVEFRNLVLVPILPKAK
ncbi:MAG: DUF1080 domain-containing protein, partial [Planctomycetes bacterium]|nr:DUF1080 domain-containing protein [Planctomycetota bacterium]